MKDYVEQCKEELVRTTDVATHAGDVVKANKGLVADDQIRLLGLPGSSKCSTTAAAALPPRLYLVGSAAGGSHSHAMIIVIVISAALLISIFFFASCETRRERLRCQGYVIGLDDWEAVGTSSSTLSLLSSALSQLSSDSEHVIGRERLLELLATLRVPKNRQDHQPEPSPDIRRTVESTAGSSSADVRAPQQKTSEADEW
ncbi:hypothetical protein ACJZ2D_004081 [Fusarium nematophilum]